jgi:hypothetical protein
VLAGDGARLAEWVRAELALAERRAGRDGGPFQHGR